VAPTFKLLLAFRALQGLLIPGVTAVAVAYLGDSYAEADLGPRVGGWIAASVAGGLTGRVFGGLLASWIHWRAPFVFFGLWTLAGALALAWTIPPGHKARTVGSGLAFRGMFGHFRNRRLLGSFVIGAGVFFATIGVFTYLPYYLTAPPFNLSTAVISSLYVIYVVGVLTSLVSGRIAVRVGFRTLMAIGLGISALGVIITGIALLPFVLLGLVVLCVGMFTVQGIAPAFVNRNASGAKGAAGALYVSFYYLGASVGSSLPGYAWQIWGWWGVVATCVGALCIALLADLILCR
jgi:YNFM family putative membrane transporter